MNTRSLDPRVNRLPGIGEPLMIQKSALDQLGTFEVFVQPKDGKPYQHEGAVHAPDAELAFILAKETFTRRFTCSGLWVADTRNVWVSPFSEGTENVYERFSGFDGHQETEESNFEIFHLMKRGKQHVHAMTVPATSPGKAFHAAAKKATAAPVFNVWAIRSGHIRRNTEEERDFWNTLPEKRFRDAANYKGGDKLKDFISQK